MKFNGIMIDCARIIERHEYYYRLVDFMASWGMNTLLFHFTDDTGCSIALPGFEHIAAKNAFTALEMKKLIAHAKKNGIDIIPELETFGHTRYLTDTKKYAHLYAGKRTKELTFNAIDPVSAESRDIMKKLIRAVKKVFSSEYIHIGCDEVNLAEYCKKNKSDEADVWTSYVNAVIGKVKDADRTPMMWADHPTKSAAIAAKLRKDVILIDWRYHRTVKDDVYAGLSRAGFRKIVVAPSIACWEYRFLPAAIALENTEKMIGFNAKHKGMGVLTTIWCPFRYLQDALWYGIAFSAFAVRSRGKVSRAKFNEAFAENVFSSDCKGPIASILSHYPMLTIDHRAARAITGKKPDASVIAEMKTVHTLAKEVLDLSTWYRPQKNERIYEAMLLAATCAYLVSGHTVFQGATDTVERSAYNELLRSTMKDLSLDWDNTRFADDPQKRKPKFPGHEDQFVLTLIEALSAGTGK